MATKKTMRKEKETTTKNSTELWVNERTNDRLLSRRALGLSSTNHVANIHFIGYNLFMGNNNTGHWGDDVYNKNWF